MVTDWVTDYTTVTNTGPLENLRGPAVLFRLRSLGLVTESR
jgi:hypothetical protein